jgi:predicted hydrocarbon binding protein
MRIGLRGFAQALSQLSDQKINIEEKADCFAVTIRDCPNCWDRSGADQPVCYLYTGMLQEAIEWITGSKECSVKEVHCMAQGNPTCEFLVQGPG